VLTAGSMAKNYLFVCCVNGASPTFVSIRGTIVEFPISYALCMLHMLVQMLSCFVPMYC